MSTVAKVKMSHLDLEVRERGSEGYFVIARAACYHRELIVPKILRNGRSGLDAGIEMILAERVP